MFDLSMFPEAVTPVTPRKNVGVTKKSFKNSGVTPDTRVTPQKHNNRNGVTGNDPEEWREAFEERAGIMEYMGGISRQEAERQAKVICLAEFRSKRLKAKENPA